CQHHYTYTFTF
nr:immunoglobulin light chain junction region [Macaca mulatta]